MSTHFDALFRANDDPWSTRERWYERRKQALLLACLPRERFRHGIEPACGSGALAEALAARCDRLLCADASAHAVAIAGRALAGQAHVQVQRRALPEEWPAPPPGGFDLVVFSEIGYYLDAAPWRAALAHCRDSLAPDAVLVACHWRGEAPDRLQGSADVHAAIDALPGLDCRLRHAETSFLLGVWAAGANPRDGWT